EKQSFTEKSGKWIRRFKNYCYRKFLSISVAPSEKAYYNFINDQGLHSNLKMCRRALTRVILGRKNLFWQANVSVNGSRTSYSTHKRDALFNTSKVHRGCFNFQKFFSTSYKKKPQVQEENCPRLKKSSVRYATT
uniref:Uncharacterized protein n=1 Tax=Parascaris univalens TaxID=6257 RepID=A0A915BFU5_PARUN